MTGEKSMGLRVTGCLMSRALVLGRWCTGISSRVTGSLNGRALRSRGSRRVGVVGPTGLISSTARVLLSRMGMRLLSGAADVGVATVVSVGYP